MAEGAPPAEKLTGTVKWFNVAKGFGFVRPDPPDDAQADLFVHQTGILAEGFRSLREGEAVEFEVEVGNDGRSKAVNVTGPEGAPPQGAERRPFLGGRGFPGARGGGGVRRGRGPRAYPGGQPALRPPPPGTPGVSSGLQVVVHNLPWDCEWGQLKDAFSAATQGVRRADIVRDRRGDKRGFGTVLYSSAAQANEAIAIMHNTQIGGRTITVRIDRFA